MSSAKHTPGPWGSPRTGGSFAARKDSNFGGYACMLHATNGNRIERVAKVYGGDADSAAVASANARLIAAAPDLLAACERALAQLLEVNPHPVRTIEALRAAIAKARG